MKMVLKSALCASFALTGSAAFAEDHEVRMERRGFFPETIYVQVGDTITFINETPNWAQLQSYDAYDNQQGYDPAVPCGSVIEAESGGSSNVTKGSDAKYDGDKDGWYFGWFSRGSSRTIAVTACMETVLFPPYIYQYSYDDQKYRGTIVFGEAPTG